MKKKQLLALALVGAMSATSAASMVSAEELSYNSVTTESKERHDFAENVRLLDTTNFAAVAGLADNDLKELVERFDAYSKTHDNVMNIEAMRNFGKKYELLLTLSGDKLGRFTNITATDFDNLKSIQELAAMATPLAYNTVSYTDYTASTAGTATPVNAAATNLADLKASEKSIREALNTKLVSYKNALELAMNRLKADPIDPTHQAQRVDAEAKISAVNETILSLNGAVIEAIMNQEINKVKDMYVAIVKEADAMLKLQKAEGALAGAKYVKTSVDELFAKYEQNSTTNDSDPAFMEGKAAATAAATAAEAAVLASANASLSKIKSTLTYTIAEVNFLRGSIVDDPKTDAYADNAAMTTKSRVMQQLLKLDSFKTLLKNYDDAMSEKDKHDTVDAASADVDKLPTVEERATVDSNVTKAEAAVKTAKANLKDATIARENAMSLDIVLHSSYDSIELMNQYKQVDADLKAASADYADNMTNVETARRTLETAQSQNNAAAIKGAKEALAMKEAALAESKIKYEGIKAQYDKLLESIYNYNAAIIKGVTNYEQNKAKAELEKQIASWNTLAVQYGLDELVVSRPEAPANIKADWVRVNGKWYYKDGNGNNLNKNSWAEIDGKWYRFEADGQMMASKWFKDTNNRWYWLNSTGRMASNEWVEGNNGSWFYAYGNGAIAENEWILVNGTWYYAENGGYVAMNKTVNVNGVNYSFDASGALK